MRPHKSMNVGRREQHSMNKPFDTMDRFSVKQCIWKFAPNSKYVK